MNQTDRDEKDGDGTSRDDLLDFQNEAPAAKEETGGEEQQAASRLPVYTTSPKGLWIPIVACIIVSGVLAAFLNYMQQITGVQEQYGISESEGVWAVLVNALVFIAIGAGSAFVLILVIRRKGVNALERIMMVAFLVLGTFIIYIFGVYFLIYLSQYITTIDIAWEYVWLAFAFVISLLLVLVYVSPKYRDSIRVHNTVVVIFGILIGSYLPSVIPSWTSLVILMGFALYDIYSVRHGPIKEMMQKMDPDITNGNLNTADLDDISIDIGIGDLAFYSMLTSITLISAEWGGPALVAATGNVGLYIIPFIAAVIGVLIGAWISFELVKKNKILPGLPMSIFIGIGLYSLAIAICLLLG
jgi:hypothetical protein